MTRSLMIFGQGAILCHPWVLKEMKAATLPDPEERLREFDRNLFGHHRLRHLQRRAQLVVSA
jgi:acyl-CoA dehydrogenase